MNLHVSDVIATRSQFCRSTILTPAQDTSQIALILVTPKIPNRGNENGGFDEANWGLNESNEFPGGCCSCAKLRRLRDS